MQADFNPRSSYEERRSASKSPLAQAFISIHAPHTRSDMCFFHLLHVSHSISIHAPHTRSDNNQHFPALVLVFQSTLLIRGATIFIHLGDKDKQYFNPRSSYEERPPYAFFFPPTSDFNPRSSYEERRYIYTNTITLHFISIHAPHTRSDAHL